LPGADPRLSTRVVSAVIAVMPSAPIEMQECYAIAIMAGIGEFERSLIRARCDAGIARAKAKGVQFGRKAKLDASQRRRLAERYAAGETMAELARDYDVSEPTISRVLQGPTVGAPA